MLLTKHDIECIYIYLHMCIDYYIYFLLLHLSFVQHKIRKTLRTNVRHFSGHASKFHRLNEGRLCSSVRDRVARYTRISDLFCNVTTTIAKSIIFIYQFHVSRISSSICESKFIIISHTHLVNTLRIRLSHGRDGKFALN